MSSWRQLQEMRSRGERPALPVIVTTSSRLEGNLRGVGALVIEHRPGERMPVQVLDGLRVILALDRCDRALAVKHLMDGRGVRCERVQAWCRCSKQLTAVPTTCGVAA
jgi:hypothetical protein